MSYLQLFQQNKLAIIKDSLVRMLKKCSLCPHHCGVNRIDGELGFCRTGRLARVSSYALHFGEEPELVGTKGSGTIFFAYCNLGCVYCQNYELSHVGEGIDVSAEKLAQMMLHLQEQGAHNINFVTPTHVIPQIIEALEIAVKQGLTLPLVYNCGGYESVETLKIISGIFDVYMPDIKYSDNQNALKYSGVSDYWEVVKSAVKEMQRYVGDLVIENGIAQKGMLIRHLVLPHCLAGSFTILDFIAQEISSHAYINIMDQYYPCWRAHEYKELSCRITVQEYQEVIFYAGKIGLHRGF